MKHLRIILATLAIVLGIGASFAFSEESDPPCVYSQQYWKNGFSFEPAKQLGLHYACIISPAFCTYYQPDPVLQPDNYVPCRQGMYYPINVQP